jgi:membrane fusion protein (multidrug efflux system)
MSYSRSTLSLVTVLLVLGGLGAGVGWRLWADGSDNAEEGVELPEGVSLPSPEGASQFSTDMPSPVRGAEVVQDTLWIRVRAAGQAEAFRRTALTAQVGGWVREVLVRENQSVTSDTRVVQIDTTEYALTLAQARADLQNADADFQQMTLFDDDIEDPAVREQRRLLARTRSGLEQAEVSLRQAELDMERTRVGAPFEGRIADLEVVVGQYVSAGDELMTIVDLDPIKVEVQVLEAQLGLLSEGRRAEVTFAAFPGETFAGSIETMNPLVDPDSRTGRVTVLIPNPRHRIRPGMYAEVSLDAEALPNRVIIPREAMLQRSRGGGELFPVLFVFEPLQGEAEGVGLAKWRYVNPGRESDTHVEIMREGPEQDFVVPGEIVLVDGHHYLAHDTRIRLVENVQAEGGRPSR